MAEVLDYLSELNGVSITVRLLMAVFCGGLIGIERGRKGQAAGCRTHMLVCIGSASVMMTNIFVYNNFESIGDPTRLGAQVVSGIGFLGAGTILVTSKNQIRGLTTAAGLWASACMGLAIGIGFYKLAIIGNIFIFLAIVIINKFDRKVYGISKIIDTYIEFNDSHVITELIIIARENDFSVNNVQIIKNQSSKYGNNAVLFSLKAKEKLDHNEVIALLGSIDGVLFIEEV